jgi:hypothetical protein
MSTTPYPGAHPFAVSDAAAQHLASVCQDSKLSIRRRANADQARAIEKLGHAMDHLIYSRIFLTDADAVKAEADAIHILMVLRRGIFEDCERVVSESHQIRRWMTERPGQKAN